ncbi:hypothetical protein SFC65_19905 [Priestia filamentosa]|uniref:hypothetical protein n=1 Tax=Priestia filamentosa TaxID=1402861 RepID=UPI003982BE74
MSKIILDQAELSEGYRLTMVSYDGGVKFSINKNLLEELKRSGLHYILLSYDSDKEELALTFDQTKGICFTKTSRSDGTLDYTRQKTATASFRALEKEAKVQKGMSIDFVKKGKIFVSKLERVIDKFQSSAIHNLNEEEPSTTFKDIPELAIYRSFLVIFCRDVNREPIVVNVEGYNEGYLAEECVRNFVIEHFGKDSEFKIYDQTVQPFKQVFLNDRH